MLRNLKGLICHKAQPTNQQRWLFWRKIALGSFFISVLVNTVSVSVLSGPISYAAIHLTCLINTTAHIDRMDIILTYNYMNRYINFIYIQ